MGGDWGYPVISPDELIRDHKEAIVIINVGNPGDANEIIGRLVVGGIPQSRILEGTRYGTRFTKRAYFVEDFLRYEDEEIFVDGGSYDLETTKFFKNICPALKKPYAFEPDKENFKKCEKKKTLEALDYIELLPYGVWSENTTLRFTGTGLTNSRVDFSAMQEIEVRSIDSITAGDPVTFIKMDVEGSELEALKGAEQTIRKYHPKLAISVYHKPEDLFEIPQYIKTIAPDYKLYLRHYSSFCGETVVYAV